MIIAGNWKMNMLFNEAIEFVRSIKNIDLNFPNVEKIVFVPYPYLHPLVQMAEGRLEIGAQNCHHKPNGAFTGEVSAAMLKSIGINQVIIGHSERRLYFNETEEIILSKIKLALQEKLRIIFCCGENQEERFSGKHFDVVQKQLEQTILELPVAMFANIVIAYEPVWAIGTGNTASKYEAQEMHSFIRSLIESYAGVDIAAKIHILYGGSCSPDNAEELFNMPDIDGGLIGGASLKLESYLKLIEIASGVEKK